MKDKQIIVKDSKGKVYIYNSLEELITMLNIQFDLMTFEMVKSDEEDTVQSLREERDMLAYENKNMAEFIKYNDKTLDDTDVGDIATGTPDVWKRFTLDLTHN